MESRGVRVFLRAMTWLAMFFLYLPLALVALYAFSKSRGATWPPDLFTLEWFKIAWEDPELKTAVVNSLIVAVLATTVALVLGSLAAFAVHRFRFFGRDTISLALVLPIALPGIVTALALSSAADVSGFGFGLHAVIVGHATFCIVVIYNNVVARLRRTSGSLTEASMDLGADGVTTFRYVTLPSIRTALLAGALLAFGLSFDEIIVTKYLAGTDLTLPIWIYKNLSKPTQRPVVNAVALVVGLVAIVPVYFAQRLAGGTGATPGAAEAMAPTRGGPADAEVAVEAAI
jgi:putative spermidine/putrescine transport system permease protein